MSDSVIAQKSPVPAEQGPVSLARELTFSDGVALVVGIVIGSGIFLVPAGVAQQLHSVSAGLSIWIVGGVLSFFGALSIAELASAFPGAGGLYVYLREAYGRGTAFVYGWALLSMIQSGSIATLAVAFGLYSGQVFGLTPARQKMASIACIAALTLLNSFGVRHGKYTQNVATVCKTGGLILLIGLLVARGHWGTLQAHFVTSEPFHLLPYGVALVAVLWAYEGWHCVSFAAGEFKNTNRDLPRALAWGSFVVAAIYVLANIAYYLVLSPLQLQNSDRAAAAAVSSVYGAGATIFISLVILISILGATNGMVLTGARVYYAMAQDKVFFPQFQKLHSRYRTPVLALTLQGIWASVLTLAGSFQELFTYVIFTAWIFYGLTVAAVIVMRKKAPAILRSFRVPAYPWVPLLFVVAALGIALSTMVNNPSHAAMGLGLVLLGLPIYLLFNFFNRR
ncbi:MAG: amino acid permease [Acidobacteria bacterium]|nr:amino acid permease [Acidobacteriota bacterium]